VSATPKNAPRQTPREPSTAPWLRTALRQLRRGLAILGALALLWLAGLIWYANDVPRAVDDTATETDAVVVLTGGVGRLDVGLDLLVQDRARKLFISGVSQEVDLDQILRAARRNDIQELRDRIVLGYAAGDTAGNARETAQWMAKEKFGSLRLVTASYHMRRSLLEFRQAMPHAVIIPHPVFPLAFRLVDWWRWPGTLSLLVSEYSKYLVTAGSLALGARPPEDVATRIAPQSTALPTAARPAAEPDAPAAETVR